MAEWKSSDRVITIINSGWIYSSPSESEITGDFVSGCILAKMEVTGGFAKVRLPDGREGYITAGPLRNLKPGEEMSDVPEII